MPMAVRDQSALSAISVRPRPATFPPSHPKCQPNRTTSAPTEVESILLLGQSLARSAAWLSISFEKSVHLYIQGLREEDAQLHGQHRGTDGESCNAAGLMHKLAERRSLTRFFISFYTGFGDSRSSRAANGNWELVTRKTASHRL